MKNSHLAIIFILIGIVIIGCIVSGLLIIIKKKKEPKKPLASRSEYLAALGGEDNLISSERSGSRIIVILKDYSLLDKEKIKEAGVTGFIEKSDKLTLVVKENAKEVYEKIFNA